MIWGIDVDSLEVVGSDFDFCNMLVDGAPLFDWLKDALNFDLFDFSVFEMDGHRIVLLRISQAGRQPTTFLGEAYLKDGYEVVGFDECEFLRDDLQHVLSRSMPKLSAEGTYYFRFRQPHYSEAVLERAPKEVRNYIENQQDISSKSDDYIKALRELIDVAHTSADDDSVKA